MPNDREKLKNLYEEMDVINREANEEAAQDYLRIRWDEDEF